MDTVWLLIVFTDVTLYASVILVSINGFSGPVCTKYGSTRLVLCHIGFPCLCSGFP